MRLCLIVSDFSLLQRHPWTTEPETRPSAASFYVNLFVFGKGF